MWSGRGQCPQPPGHPRVQTALAPSNWHTGRNMSGQGGAGRGGAGGGLTQCRGAEGHRDPFHPGKLLPVLGSVTWTLAP